ncbi:peptidase S8/S53 domain-containing protein [Linnemannia elongata]|nr:peptidase S8/S53 domain-containing protein [Linnemannia elongata]
MATYLIDSGKGKALDEIIPDSYTVILKDGHTFDSFRRTFEGCRRLLQGDNSKINEKYEEVPVVYATLSQAMYNALKSAPEVDNITEAHVMKMATVEARPNPRSWGLSRISKRARDLRKPYFFPTQAGDGVTVYVIDSGVNTTHSEFNSRAMLGKNFVPGTSDGDENGHGTHVAAIIGGHSCGVASRVNIVSLKVLNTRHDGIDTRVVAALKWVEQDVRVGRKVVNISLEGPKSEEMDKQIESLFKNNIPSFVAAGNRPNMAASDGSPSGARYAYTVAATDSLDCPFHDNSFGGHVNIFAPGVDIASAAFNNVNQYRYETGTSMAAPHVAGVAALRLSIKPDMTAEEVLDTITYIATRKAIQGDLRDSPNFLVFNGVVDHQGGGPGWASSVILFLRRRMFNLIGS